MCPNFDKLKDVENEFLRNALYTATGEEREKLEKAFPEFYVKDLEEIRIPASILRKLAITEYQADMEMSNSELASLSVEELNQARELYWLAPLSRLGMPLLHWGGSENEYPPLPEEIWAQLANRELKGATEISYLGQQLLLIYFCEISGPLLHLGDIFPEKMGEGWMDRFTFVLSRFINLNS